MRRGNLQISAFLPVLPKPSGQEALRASFGAAMGIGACSLLAIWLPHVGALSLALIAPLGATAVLAFAVPNAPLAQPWSAIMGNILSALATVAVLSLHVGPWSPTIAVGLAILVMMLARALHPPGGAVALLAALDPEPVLEAGIAFAFVPVGVMTVTLIGAAIIFNRLTGRVYPFRQSRPDSSREAAIRLGLPEDELGALLRKFNQSANIGVVDLGRLLAAAEQEAANHRFDGVSCAEIMTRDLVSVRPETSIHQAAKLFRKHRIKSLPVIDAEGCLTGIILQADIIDAMARSQFDLRLVGRPRQLTAGQIARPADRGTTVDTPVGQLLNRLAVQGVEIVPVMSGPRLAGIITRSDVIRLLFHGVERRETA